MLSSGPAGYDAWGHLSYVLFLDLYQSVPFAGQGQSTFHPPLHYAIGWLIAQAGDAEVLVRGLAAVASAASLGIAGITAWVVRATLPGRPLPPLLAFVAVAFWPPQLYSSPMPGNEPTAAFFGSAALAVFLLATRPSRPSLGAHAVAGVLGGLALLSKFSALVPLLAMATTLAVRRVGVRNPGGRFARSIALLVGPALLLAAPFYARNVVEFGNPFELSRGRVQLEATQQPGERQLHDFLSFPLRLFTDPQPREDHLLRSVWGSLYVRMWAEKLPDPALRIALVVVGLVPTGLALLGFALALHAMARRPDSTADTLMVLLASGSLTAFAIFAWRVPIFSALKASYLLNASVAYGYFVARGVAGLRARTARRAAAGALCVAALVATAAYTRGLLAPRRGDVAAMAMLHGYFGQYDAARALYRAEIQRLDGAEAPRLGLWVGWPISYRFGLAGLELEAGQPDRALELFLDALQRPRPDTPLLASRAQQLSSASVAAALAEKPQVARELLAEALSEGEAAEPLANRGALRGAEGDLANARADLLRAVELRPDLTPAWRSLAQVGHRLGDDATARWREAARRSAARAPRGHPYGVGDGLRPAARRFLLELRDDGISLYRPSDGRGRQDRS
jgi:tetratricopeptide (TPR) repeat protein